MSASRSWIVVSPPRRCRRGSSRPRRRSSATYDRSATSKPPAWLEAELPRVDGQVDRAVEHQPADLVGEQVGVRRAELGAVGGAEVDAAVASPSAARSTSMSRAASMVVTCADQARRSCRRSPGRTPRGRPASSAPPRASSGSGSAGQERVELARRRGSRPGRTRRCRAGRSRRCRSRRGSASPERGAACSAYDVPGAPGPPGLTTSEPIRASGSSAGSLSTRELDGLAARVAVVHAAPSAWRTRSSPRTRSQLSSWA